MKAAPPSNAYGADEGAHEVEVTIDGEGSDGGTFSGKEATADIGKYSSPEDTRSIGQPAVPAQLRREVRRLFDGSAYEAFDRNRKSGSLNTGALASFSTGNTRLFKRRADVEGIDSAVVILVDISGSMFSRKQRGPGETSYNLFDIAAPAAVALAETLKAARVEVSIVAFGDCFSVVKGFNEPLNKATRAFNRIRNGGGTEDFAAVKLAHQLLLSHPAQRKVCFVITDGVGDTLNTNAQCVSGEALGITTIGLGIQHHVSAAYPQSVRVDNLADLGRAAFDKIKVAA